MKKEETKPREDTLVQLDNITLNDIEKFQLFDKEYQLAIVIALFNKVIIFYDYGIGNAEFLLKSKMTQPEIDQMKQVLQNQLKHSRDATEDLIYQSQKLLHVIDIPNKGDLPLLIDVENDYLKKVDEMIACLHAVTIENAQESRIQMDQLKHEYLQLAASIGVTSVLIVTNAELDTVLYRNIVKGLLSKP